VLEAIPYDRANAFQRAVRRAAGSAPGAWLLARVLPHVDRPLARIAGAGTFASAASGLPLVVLTTTGARSGQRRTAPVLGFETDDGLVLIASNFGQERDPAWRWNLRANPECEIEAGDGARPYRATEAEGELRERAWEAGVRLYPGWAAYARRATGRRIAVFVLRPAEAAAS
jgi:deazaflavin-dependent oxidoreductase (nitroreductase family)